MNRLLIAFLILLNYACSDSEQQSLCSNAKEYEVLDVSNLAGCTWVLRDENNDSFEPINLLELRPDIQSGDKLKAELKEETQFASICQTGEIVTIVCIE